MNARVAYRQALWLPPILEPTDDKANPPRGAGVNKATDLREVIDLYMLDKEHSVLYEPYDPVWVGRTRGSERKGTVLRYLGEGHYSVSVAGREGVRTLVEGLLQPRREDEAC